MFTGLVQDVGFVQEIKRSGELIRLTIRTTLPVGEFLVGESIAVDGICLTVVGLGSESFQIEVSPETLERTTLAAATPASPVNLERALQLSDRLGGHLMTGHIDGIGHIQRRGEASRHLDMDFGVPSSMSRYLVEKGSVGVDGISLTVNRYGEGWFGVTLIPHTIQQTTLRKKRVGDRVNIECDILGKYVERVLEARDKVKSKPSNEITEAYLREHGFL